MPNNRGYEMPTDLPAAACGRCMWFDLRDSQGNGKCLIFEHACYYKCMPCVEYEMDTTEIRRK